MKSLFLLVLLLALSSFTPHSRRYDCHQVDAGNRSLQKSFTLVFREGSLDILRWDHREDLQLTHSPVNRVDTVLGMRRLSYTARDASGTLLSLQTLHRDGRLQLVMLTNYTRTIYFHIDYPLYQ